MHINNTSARAVQKKTEIPAFGARLTSRPSPQKNIGGISFRKLGFAERKLDFKASYAHTERIKNRSAYKRVVRKVCISRIVAQNLEIQITLYPTREKKIIDFNLRIKPHARYSMLQSHAARCFY